MRPSSQTSAKNDLGFFRLPESQVSRLRTLAGKANGQRLNGRFTVVTLKLFLQFAKQHHLLDTVEWLLGQPINIAILDSPLSVYNALSVGLFGMRLLVNVIDILQHTVDDKLNGPASTRTVRFKEKLYKHHHTMINDVVWGGVNALGNYAAYFHIPPRVPNILMLVSTVFDIAWFGYKWYLEDQDYKIKYDDYKIKYDDYKAKIKMCEENPEEFKKLELDLEKLKLDLEKLKLDSEKLTDEHKKRKAEIFFNIAATCLLLVGFTAAFILSPPALLPLCYFVCNIAIAMFLSDGKYGAWKKAKLIDNNEQKVQEAWNELVSTMAKNTFLPFIFLGAFTVSVPLAIALAYLAYEYGLLTQLEELTPTCPAP